MTHRKLIRSLAAAALLGASLLVATPGAAQADDNSEFPSCRFLGSGAGSTYGGAEYTGSGDWYYSTPIWTVPSSSACEDINITDQWGDPWRWRVRFYPSGGGSYTNSWKSACGICIVVVATDVLAGTRYRIEGHRWDGVTQTVYDRPLHVRD